MPGSGPAAAQFDRRRVSVNRFDGARCVLRIAYTNNLQVEKNAAFTPQSFYSAGTQPNTAPQRGHEQQDYEAVALSNFGGAALSNPAVYNRMSLNLHFAPQQISISNLVTAYPQMGGLSLNQSLGATT